MNLSFPTLINIFKSGNYISIKYALLQALAGCRLFYLVDVYLITYIVNFIYKCSNKIFTIYKIFLR